MPRVPGYQQRVNPTPIPGVQQSDQSAPGISADALGAGHAQALQNTGSELTKIGVEIEQRANTLAAKQAYDAASQEMRELLHNPTTGIFSLRGNGAKGAAGTTQKELQKIKERHTKGLSGRAVEQFSRFWDPAEDSALVSSARHESAQMQVAEKDTNESIKKNSIASVAANYADDKALQTHLDAGLATIASEAAREKWTNDQIELARREFISRAISGAATTATIDGKTQRATDLLKKFEKDLDPNLTGELRQHIQQENDTTWAQTETDRLMAGKKAEDEAAVLQEAAKLASGKRRDMLEQRIQARFIDLNRAKQVAMKEQMNQAAKNILAAPSMSSAQKMLDSMTTDPDVRQHAQSVFNLKFGEEKAIQQSARLAAMAESRAEAREAKREAKAGAEFRTVQQRYESLVNFAGGDPVKMIELIRKQFSGKDEEDLVQYAKVRAQEVTPRTQRQTVAQQFALTKARQQIMGLVRAKIDESRSKGEPVDESVIAGWLSAPEFRAKDGENIASDKELNQMVQYWQKGGRDGHISQSRVESILKNIAPNIKGLEEYPDLYAKVLERIPPGADPTDKDIGDIVRRLAVQKGSIPAAFGLFRASTTALQAMRANRLGEYNIDIDPKDRVFFKTYLKVLSNSIPGLSDLKIDDNMVQEFGEQVIQPDIFGTLPRVIPEDPSGMPKGATYGFYNWLKMRHPEVLVSPKVEDANFVKSWFEQYQRSIRNVGTRQ